MSAETVGMDVALMFEAPPGDAAHTQPSRSALRVCDRIRHRVVQHEERREPDARRERRQAAARVRERRGGATQRRGQPSDDRDCDNQGAPLARCDAEDQVRLTRLRMRRLGMLDDCSRTRDHQARAAIAETHQVRRLPVRAADLDDLTRPLRLARVPAARPQPVPHRCPHWPTFCQR
jgi:hypothetical protein